MKKTVLITMHQHAELPTYETFGKGKLEHKFRVQTGIREINNEYTLAVEMDELTDFSMVAGTALQRMIKWIEVQKMLRSKGGLMASLPIDLRFEVVDGDTEQETMLFDTATAGIKHKREKLVFEELRQRLKVGASAKSQRQFCFNFMGLFRFISSPMERKNIETLIAELDIKAAMEAEEKEYTKWLEVNAN